MYLREYNAGNKKKKEPTFSAEQLNCHGDDAKKKRIFNSLRGTYLMQVMTDVSDRHFCNLWIKDDCTAMQSDFETNGFQHVLAKNPFHRMLNADWQRTVTEITDRYGDLPWTTQQDAYFETHHFGQNFQTKLKDDFEKIASKLKEDNMGSKFLEYVKSLEVDGRKAIIPHSSQQPSWAGSILKFVLSRDVTDQDILLFIQAIYGPSSIAQRLTARATNMGEEKTAHLLKQKNHWSHYVNHAFD